MDNMETDLIRVIIEGLKCGDLCQSKDNWWNALNTVTKCRVA